MVLTFNQARRNVGRRPPDRRRPRWEQQLNNPRRPRRRRSSLLYHHSSPWQPGGDGHCSQIELHSSSSSSFNQEVNHIEGSVFNLSDRLPTSYLSLLHSPAATRARMLLLRPEIPRQTATSARVRKSAAAAPEVAAAAVQWWDGRDSFPATCQLAPGNTLI